MLDLTIDPDALDRLRKEPKLAWSDLSPSAELKPGPRTGKFRLGSDQLLVDATGKSKISVQDFCRTLPVEGCFTD